MPWRLVDTDLASPPFTAAADEAIALARSKDLVPDTLHLYRREGPTVSLGYFQSVKKDVDAEFCERNGITILRRVSGGSAIYTDPGHLIYALIVSEDTLPKDKHKAYERVCSAIVRALELLGLNAGFKPVNDVLVGGSKISGSAQMRRWGVVLQHGTLILENDPGMMFGSLKTIKDKDVTSLAEQLGNRPDIAKVKEAIVRGFSEVFGVLFDPGGLTGPEKEQISDIVAEKYGRREWNYRK
jgi:lipoate-protein ligase A